MKTIFDWILGINTEPDESNGSFHTVHVHTAPVPAGTEAQKDATGSREDAIEAQKTAIEAEDALRLLLES